jgi:uncharacterized protein YjbI with pentapeptide repeats
LNIHDASVLTTLGGIRAAIKRFSEPHPLYQRPLPSLRWNEIESTGCNRFNRAGIKAAWAINPSQLPRNGRFAETMRTRELKERPRPWPEERQAAFSVWTIPFRRINWWLAWVSWALSHWALLDVLDHLGTFSVLIAVIFYFTESGNRIKQKHYQAWQVINTAQGKGGSGGRIEAMQELNADGVSLTGVDAGGAFLRGIQLEHAHLERCDLHAADLRTGDLKLARLSDSNLQGANFREADLSGADLSIAELQDADLTQSNLEDTNLADADLSRADLRFADVGGSAWKNIQSLRLANIYGIKNASSEFLAFAQKQGAVSLANDDDWNALLSKAVSAPSPATK